MYEISRELHCKCLLKGNQTENWLQEIAPSICSDVCAAMHWAFPSVMAWLLRCWRLQQCCLPTGTAPATAAARPSSLAPTSRWGAAVAMCYVCHGGLLLMPFNNMRLCSDRTDICTVCYQSNVSSVCLGRGGVGLHANWV